MNLVDESDQVPTAERAHPWSWWSYEVARRMRATFLQGFVVAGARGVRLIDDFAIAVAHYARALHRDGLAEVVLQHQNATARYRRHSDRILARRIADGFENLNDFREVQALAVPRSPPPEYVSDGSDSAGLFDVSQLNRSRSPRVVPNGHADGSDSETDSSEHPESKNGNAA